MRLAAVVVAVVALRLVLLPLQTVDGGRAQASAAAPGDRASELLGSCFSRDCKLDATGWEHLTADRPSCLSATKVWWSVKPPGVPITLVTQLSADRLQQLQAQCRTWGGPVAAALYLPLLAGADGQLTDKSQQALASAQGDIDTFFRGSEARRHMGCQLRLVLISEVFQDRRALLLYPVNTLRNYARLLADTDLITNIDVDMVPSTSITKSFEDPAAVAQYKAACAQRKLFVWPAFETTPGCGGPTTADRVAAVSKPLLAKELSEVGNGCAVWTASCTHPPPVCGVGRAAAACPIA